MGRGPTSDVASGTRARLAILIPAHDEESGIATTLRSVLPQLNTADRVLVVADNCTDNTAAIAANQGAEIVIRKDSSRRGKGYALDFGVRHLERDAPEIVIIVDADCEVAPGTVDRLARLCSHSGRPVQALYLMHAPPDASLRLRIAEFAWIVKNQVRPTGLARLQLPCQLMGTGMAFPWSTLRCANLATGHIVEDLKLGLDLALSGTAPLFAPTALVASHFPASNEGIRSQRVRWEHGHLGVIFAEAPRLLLASLRRADLSLLALGMDLLVPPLALLSLLVVTFWSASAVFCWVTRLRLPLEIASVTAVCLGLSVLVSWLRWGRRVISFADLVLAPAYALRKIPLYVGFLFARQMQWVRSKRDKS
jgi:cellulose synthase/poly-beta-1,6-N-acetylglucosamine synthase-like glycosyltransferase